jgi:hypothetical protein
MGLAITVLQKRKFSVAGRHLLRYQGLGKFIPNTSVTERFYKHLITNVIGLYLPNYVAVKNPLLGLKCYVLIDLSLYVYIKVRKKLR